MIQLDAEQRVVPVDPLSQAREIRDHRVVMDAHLPGVRSAIRADVAGLGLDKRGAAACPGLEVCLIPLRSATVELTVIPLHRSGDHAVLQGQPADGKRVGQAGQWCGVHGVLRIQAWRSSMITGISLIPLVDSSYGM